MHGIIDKYAKGNVEIKFRTAVPLMSNRLRRIISGITIAVFVSFIFIVIPKTLENFNMNGLLPIALCLGLMLLIFELATRKWLFKIKPTGSVKFHERDLEVQTVNPQTINRVPYAEIKGIRYQRNVPKSLMGKTVNTKTFVVEFVLYNKSSIFLEIERWMFLTKDELVKFRMPEPDIEAVLNSIECKYGTERVNKIRIPEFTTQS